MEQSQDIIVSLPEKTNIYINNIKSQDKHTVEIYIPDGIISVKPNEELYISVISFNTFYTFYQVINGYNNNFNVYHQGTKYSFSLPYGNISVDDIVTYFNSIKSTAEINITYDKKTNKFIYTKQNQNHTIILEPINCHALLGFKITETQITIPSNSSLTSTIPINVMSITNLFIHLDAGFDLSINDNNLDNFKNNGNLVKPNNIVCAIPIKNCYNSIISYENYDGGTSFNFKANKQEIVQSLSLTIKDHYDNPIPDFPDFNMIIQLTKKLKVNPHTSLLRTINDSIMRILFLFTSFLTS
jgi:acyl carrier protein